MSKMLRRHVLLAAPALLIGKAIHAQPIAGGRPVRLIVPFAPGGAFDLVGRILAERLPAALGNHVVVENRAGAGGLIGVDAVAKADKDGTTIGLVGVAALCAAPFLYSRMPFDPVRDLAPVTQITDGAMLCVVNADNARRNGWTDFRALIAWAKAHPDTLRMGYSGPGSTAHLNIMTVGRLTGASFLRVPYRGGSTTINDLVAGHIDMMFDVMPALIPHVQAGALVPLAVSTPEPVAAVPSVPGMASFADLGLGQYSFDTWNAIMAPAGTPGPIVARLFQAIRQVATQPDFAERLKPLGYGVVTSESPAALAAKIARETPVWKQLVETSGARLD
ncbi:tripartite tricarboxylate transporter substrate binding protein [Roseomonas soli]|uniref:Tripartite tricarboxylate transporter substrate binding protein n=2 Tax=Neoroseomonas soli TaxID=1081025 RepID=A0A9X9X100_9PROT|nr:tripartite tricarboxylate transporter substrate binding protein [Neoroseomonas soli]